MYQIKVLRMRRVFASLVGAMGRGPMEFATPRSPVSEIGKRATAPNRAPLALPPLRPLTRPRTGFGAQMGSPFSLRGYASQSQSKELYASQNAKIWQSHVKTKLDEVKAVKERVKGRIPVICAATKAILLGAVKHVLDIMWSLILRITYHAIEGLKSDVNNKCYYGFTLVLLWALYQLGLLKGIKDLESSDDAGFNEIMERISKGDVGFLVLVQIGVVALNMLHQIVTRVRKIDMQMEKGVEKIGKDIEAVRSVTESYENRLQQYERELSTVKEELNQLKIETEARWKAKEAEGKKKE